MEPAEAMAAPARAPSAYNNVLVLFNEKAGSVAPGDGERLADTLREAEVERFAIVPADRMSRRLFARADAFDLIVVLGGDGTARAAASLAPRNGPPLLILPGGTLNILPKALLGELAWPEALKAALERGVIKRLPAGAANGERFFVAALFGAPTLLARAREAVREGKPITAISRFRHFLGRVAARRLRARRDREPMRRAEAIGALCPAFSGAIEGKDLEWVRLGAGHLIDLARLSVRALSDDWRADGAVEVEACQSGDIYSPGLIPATLDGEPRQFLSRVRITYDPEGVRVLALEPEAPA